MGAAGVGMLEWGVLRTLGENGGGGAKFKHLVYMQKPGDHLPTQVGVGALQSPEA